MATIKNIIQTQFTSTGAGGVNKQVETLNKGQTRLAQSSASAGRSFAAQSQGLGGLVAAYAGAAATTFALQQAFSKLAAAARAEQTLEGLKSLASASGESSSILLKNVREITKNQLTLAEAAQQINLSLSAGFDQRQIEGLATVALKASRALGRDLTDAYTRVIRGSAKLETELLDELGIYTKIGPSTRAYAAALGRTAESLTEYERRQAFVNSVIEEGNRKFSAINTTLPTAAEKLEAFGVKVIDLATDIGILLANKLAPLADFLTNNFAGSLALVSGLLALVAKTGLTQLSVGIEAFEKKIVSVSNTTTAWVTKNIGGFKAYGEAAQEAIQTVNTQLKGLSKEEQSQLASLRDTSKQRALTSAELKKANLILKEREDGLNKLITTQTTEITKLKESIVATKAAGGSTELLDKKLSSLNARLAANNTLLEATRAQTLATAAAQATLGAKIGTVVSTTLTGLGNVASMTLRAGSSLIGFATAALGAVATISLLGSTIAGVLGKQEAYNALIKETTLALGAFFNPGAANSTQEAFNALAADALTDMEKVNSKLKDINTFTIKDKAFGITVDVEKTKEDLVREVGAIFEEIAKKGQQTFTESFTSASGISGGIIGYIFGSSMLKGLASFITARGLTAIGGALGSVAGPIGTAAGAAIGAAAGAAFDYYFLQSMDNTDLEAVADALIEAGRKVYNDPRAFQGVNDLLANAIYKIEEQYGALAELSFEGNAYYKTMIQVAEAIADSSNNLDVMTDLAKNLGISIVTLKDNFYDLTSELGNVQLTPKLLIPDLELPPLTITIQDEKGLFSRLADIKSKVEEIYEVDMESNAEYAVVQVSNFGAAVSSVAEKIIVLATVNQEASKDILLANNNLQSFITSVDDGSITLEKFAENEASVIKTLTRASAALDTAKTNLKELTEERKKALEVGVSAEILAALDAEITAQRSIVAENNKGIITSFERLQVVLNTSEALKEQLRLEENLTTLFDAELKTKLNLLAIDQATGALAATAFEKDLARANYLNQTLAANKAAYEERLAFESKVNEVLKAAGKDQIGLQSIIFSQVGETGQQVLNNLDAYNNLGGALAQINTLQGETVKEADNYVTALKAAEVSSLQIYENLRQSTNELAKQVKEVNQSIDNLVAEDRIVKINLEVESMNLNYELVQANIDAQISALESQISIVEALSDLDNFATVDSIVAEVNAALTNLSVKVEVPKELQNLGAVEAAKTVTQKQLEILNLQIAAEDARYQNEIYNIVAQKSILYDQKQLEDSKRAAEQANRVAEIQLQQNQIQALGDLYSSSLEGTRSINQGLVDSLATVFTDAAARFATVMNTANPGGIAAPTIAGDANVAANVKAAVTASKELTTTLIDGTNRYYKTLDQIAQENYDTQMGNLTKQAEIAKTTHESNIEGIKNEAVETAIAGRGALKQLAEEGAKGAEEQAKSLEEMQDLLNEAGKKVKELTKQLAEQVLAALQEAVTGVMQKKLDLLVAQEAMISDTLSYVASKTEDASSRLQESLEKEISLKDEVNSKTESLNQSYADFINSLGDANSKVNETGKEYIDRLLEQKQSIIELYKTGSARIAQEGVAQTLDQIKIDLEKSLEEVTAKRIKSEEKLQKVQQAFGLITDMLSGKFMQMTNTVMQLSQAVAAFNAMSSAGSGMGMTFQPMMNQFSESVSQFTKAAKTAGKAVQATTAGQTKTQAGAKTEANVVSSLMPKLETGMQLLTSALSGFNIGSIIGQLTGDTGMGSSIGGLVGGLVSALPALTKVIGTGLSAAFGSSIGGVLSAAIPVLGPIVGALLGGLFSKKPKGQAEGTLTSEGFTTTSMSGRKVDLKGLASIADVALTNIVGSLNAAGISFTDTVKTSISFYKKGINGATLEFASGFKASFSGGTAEEAGQFFIDSFFQGLKIGSLKVDEAVPSAARIQAAIDRFASLSDISEKTSKRFEKAIEFASKFDETLVSLNGTGSTIAQVFSVIEKAALAGAASMNRFYSEFLKDTEEVFGAASSEYTEAYDAVVTNALAQIGLAKDLSGNIITAAEAMSQLNTGAVLIKDTITGIQAFSTVLEDLEIQEIEDLISTAINAQLNNIVLSIGDSLTESIDKLKNPASAAAYELRDIMEAGAARITEVTGVYDQLNASLSEGIDVNSELITEAAANITRAAELAGLQIDTYLGTLDKSALEAIITNQAWGDAVTLAAAETRLAIIVEYERIQAIEKFIDISKNFKKRLAEITGQFIRLADAPISFTAITSVMKAFNQEVSTDLSNTFTNLLNSIGSGSDITRNFETAIDELNTALNTGKLDTLSYVNGLEMLSDVTVSVLEEINSMVEEAESLVSQIAQGFNSSKDVVISAIEELGTQVITLTQNITDKTSEILGIYDDTLSSVAESGNELFDLRDTAKEAFETAAKAVSEFEKSNKLSGRSSATLRGELLNIESQLSSLLAAGNLDFSGYVEFTELSSRQGALKRELKSIVAVESEYQNLLDKRGSTQEDLVFIEATIASLNEDLIDTRIKESDIISKAKEATVTFTKSQQELQDITQLLADSNFNLNQARIDEESAISKIRVALAEFNNDTTSLTSILNEVGGTAGTTLRNSFIQAASGNAEIMFANLGDIARNAEIAAAVAQANTAFDSFENLIAQVGSYFNPVATQLNAVSTSSTILSDKFVTFNDDLVKYLDTEGLAQFYGNGGIFANFRDSLLTTLQTDGFDILTAAGGPLESFNLNLHTIGNAVTTLTQSGNFLSLSIETVQTSFGNLVTALGTDLGGLTAAFAGITVVSQSIQSLSASNFNMVVDGLGAIQGTLTSIGDLNINLITVDDITSIFSSIEVVNSSLNDISFEVSANAAATAINSSIAIVDSTLNSIELTPVTNSTVEKINVAFNAITSTINNIDLTNVTASTVDEISVAFNTVNSTLSNIDLVTATASTVGKIDVAFNAINSTLNNINLATATNSTVSKINTAITTINSTLTNVNLVTATTSTVTKIDTAFTSINSALTNVTLTTATNSVINMVNATFLAIGGALAGITLSSNITSTLNNIDLVDSTNSVIDQVNVSFDAIDTTLNNVTLVTATNSIITRITTAFNTINSALTNVTFVTPTASTVGQITNLGVTINSALSAVNFNTSIATANSRLVAVNSTINGALAAFNFAPNLQAATNGLSSISSTINTALSGTGILAIQNTFAGLVAVFSSDAKTSVDNFKLSIDKFKNLTAEINSVNGLGREIATLNSNTGFTGLIQKFRDLQAQITLATGVSGLDAVKNQISRIATDLGTAWSRVSLQVSQLPTRIDVTVQGGFTSTDTGFLRTIATNSGRVKVIDKAGLNYKTLTLAKGGPVEGPGTSTSDSIPARLSDGEYVIKASSAKMVGKDILSMINSGVSIEDIVAKLGRYNDTMVAHITPEEADLLKRAGGSGTKNPRTGLYEFFNRGAGAMGFGGLFDEEEKAYLNTAYGSRINAANTMFTDGAHFGSSFSLANNPNNKSYTTGQWTINPLAKDYGLETQDLFDSAGWLTENRRISSTHYGLNDIRNAREMDLISEVTSGYGGYVKRKKKNWLNAILGAILGAVLAVATGGLSLAAGAAIGGLAGAAMSNSKFSTSAIAEGVTGGYKDSNNYSVDADLANKVLGEGKLLKQFTRTDDLRLRGPAIGNSSLGTGTNGTKDDFFSNMVDKLNSIDPAFFDFYMLGDPSKAITNRTIFRSSAADKITRDNKAYGGLVTKSAQRGMLGKRDSVSAMLEPGEFILRKPIVDKIGIDTLNKVNAGSGDFGGDVSVEVNINNNGVPVNVTATPQIRRENEKIIVDVILEDIRTNGPIRQQIRSLR